MRQPLSPKCGAAFPGTDLCARGSDEWKRAATGFLRLRESSWVLLARGLV